MPRREIEPLVLELLATAPSSFAALFGYVSRGVGIPITVGAVWEVLVDFEHKKWVRAYRLDDGHSHLPTDLERARAVLKYHQWLDGASASDLSVEALSHDQVGFWFEIESGKRLEWAGRVGGDSIPRWVLDQDERTCTLTIRADTIALAEQALSDWQRGHPNYRTVPTSRELEPLSDLEGYRVRLHIGFERR